MCWDLTNKEAFDTIAYMLAVKNMNEMERRALIRALQVLLENRDKEYNIVESLQEVLNGTDL